ncbi:hypothetical protein [Cytobacillus oceanisediminis]|uniref:hypothetical protein n=1 Tax=Cytobacillus oceanisediminis TaxID=665099 RepID=UPI001FB52637|nr:hypothetical protein [Cytobacillus oceanisediminis]UOE58022.1 hypothetical protein IRB79_27550 [Cytobacillus oceanisediminis]
MENTLPTQDICVYAFKNNKWIKRRRLDSVTVSQQYEIADLLEKKYGSKHFFFPKEINPEEYPLILDMETILLERTQSYRNDFYLHDIHAYFTKGKNALWMLRNTGTDFLPLDRLEKDFETYYRELIGVNSSYYVIDDNKLIKINREKAVRLLLLHLEKAA